MTIRAVLCTALVLAGIALPLRAAETSFVVGTSQEADTIVGLLQRRIYAEAFRRLDLPVHFVVMPLQRLTVASEQGQIDADVARVLDYGSTHPELVRVEEPVYEIVWSLFATNPSLHITSLSELAQRSWRATYLRGVGICERTLARELPAERRLDVTSDAQGFNMLRLGRSEVHCTGDLSALTLQSTPEFRDGPALRRVLDIGAYPVYPYLHRRHAELALRFAAVLRQMRADGLIAQYRAEAVRDAERR